jgi:hypothetical protein
MPEVIHCSNFSSNFQKTVEKFSAVDLGRPIKKLKRWFQDLMSMKLEAHE